MARVCAICSQTFSIDQRSCPTCGCAIEERGDAVPRLVRALQRRWREPEAVATIVTALGRHEDRAAHDALLHALAHESMLVRAAAARCLQAFAKAS